MRHYSWSAESAPGSMATSQVARHTETRANARPSPTGAPHRVTAFAFPVAGMRHHVIRRMARS